MDLHAAALEACGLAVKKDDYASMHLQVEDDDLRRKTLGAVLMGLGLAFDTPLPNYAILKELNHA